ncbi:MAG: DUF1801 domain-containing protein [Actinomycetota bacterium]|nr:DUF1801 domain-containing protein [Actinomycetota bacterium]
MLRAMGDWRDEKLSEVRGLVKEALPEVVEEMKWKKPSNPEGVHTWSHEGLIGHGQIFKDKVKVTFAYGAKIDDPKGLFNASLEGNSMRAIDLHEGDELNEAEFKALVRRAAELNES